MKICTYIQGMRKCLLLYLSSLLINVHAQQNLKENFIPLRSEGILPVAFTQDIKKSVREEIAELKKSKDPDKNTKAIYLAESCFAIDRTIKSGSTLSNNEITNYLNQLADVVLAKNPVLRREIQIYTIKSPIVNAATYFNGNIFFYLGLIAQAENEAQLSFILSHEITHYVKKHNIRRYLKNKKIDGNYEGKNRNERIALKSQFSRENESEADTEGFKLFEQTNYDLKQAPKMIDMLQYSHLPFELMEFKKSFFESENFKLPSRYFLNEVSSIKVIKEDDSLSTHPSSVKRKSSLETLMLNKDNTGRVKSIVGNDKFLYIRDLARFELCRIYLRHRDYMDALYSAYILSTKYPDNLFLSQIVSKCLYGLVLQKSGDLKYGEGSDMDGIPFYNDIESYPQQLYYFNGKIPDNEFSILTMNYVYRAHKKFPKDPVLNCIADSMFKIMYYTEWGISDFTRTNNKTEALKSQDNQGKSKTEVIAIMNSGINNRKDTAYYKDVFVDLFMNDDEFSKKFPIKGGNERKFVYTPKSYKVQNTIKKIKEVEKIDKVLSVRPFYYIISDKDSETNDLEADENQEKLISTITTCGTSKEFEIITLDPGLIEPNEVEKLNDYSIISDWIYERADGHDNDKSRVPVFNTDEVQRLVKKYGTSYVLRTGVFVYKLKKTETFFYSLVYDLIGNKLVYLKSETIKGQPSNATVNSMVCEVFRELKTGK